MVCYFLDLVRVAFFRAPSPEFAWPASIFRHLQTWSSSRSLHKLHSMHLFQFTSPYQFFGVHSNLLCRNGEVLMVSFRCFGLKMPYQRLLEEICMGDLAP